MLFKIYNDKNSSKGICNYCGSIQILVSEHKACHRCALNDSNILMGKREAKRKYNLTKETMDKVNDLSLKFKGKIPVLHAKTLSDIAMFNQLDNKNTKEIQKIFKEKLEENRQRIQHKVDSIKEYLVDLSCKIDGHDLVDINNDRWLHNDIFICASDDSISDLDAVYKSLSILNREIKRRIK
jgi:hypothetical protein